MRRLIVTVLLAFACTALTAQAGPKYQYSGQASEPVISLDFRGSRLKRIDDSPTMSIYADGRVVIPQIYAHTRAYSGQLSQTELQSLLDLIIGKHQFFDFDERRVAQKLSVLSGPLDTLPAHLATTVIRVNANHRSKAVSYYGLGNEPTVEETEHLLAIRLRLEQIMSIMKLGGAEEAGQWLALANRELRAQDPKAQALALTDLRSTAIRADGSADVRFARVSAAKSVSVSISINQAGHSTIAVAHDDLLSRAPQQIH